jgi:SAM-dependent methyltransferase
MAKNIRNLLIHHFHDRALKVALEKYATGRLIDIGCGVKPYETMARPLVTEHVGLDRENPFNKGARVDLVGTAYAIPCGDAAFNVAMSTGALEHLAEPEEALRECFRVLKPGGHAIYTVPFFWHIHAAPWDYYRFTKFGLDHVFRKAGFEIVEIKPLAGFWVTFGQLFIYYLCRYEKGFLKWTFIFPAISLLIQATAFALDWVDRAHDWTWMYLIVARKPVAGV